MTQHTAEPPAENNVLKLTFDVTDDSFLVDTSPQANDALVRGGNAEFRPGIIGSGIRFPTGVYAQLPEGVLTPNTPFTVVFWMRANRGIEEQRIVSLREDLQFTTRLDSDGNFEAWTGDWHTVGQVPDGEEVLCAVRHDGSGNWRAQIGEQSTSWAASVRGDSWANRLGASAQGSSEYNAKALVVDELYIFDSELSNEQIRGVRASWDRGTVVESMGDAWTSDAMPWRGGNQRLGASLATVQGQTLRDVDDLLSARFIGSSAGRVLSRHGDNIGVSRKEGEGDAKYRKRLKAKIAAGRSSGTAKDLFQAAATIFDVSKEDVELVYVSPATCRFRVPTEAITESPLTSSELVEALGEAVPAGHDVEVTESVTNPFTLKSVGDSDNADLGLTSDSISTGGRLVTA